MFWQTRIFRIFRVLRQVLETMHFEISRCIMIMNHVGLFTSHASNVDSLVLFVLSYPT